MWTLKYYRYCSDCVFKAPTKEEALDFGVFGEDIGSLSMYMLIDPDGNVAMNEKDLTHYYVHEAEHV